MPLPRCPHQASKYRPLVGSCVVCIDSTLGESYDGLRVGLKIEFLRMSSPVISHDWPARGVLVARVDLFNTL